MIKKSVFIKSISNIKDIDLFSYPSVVLIGKSNVGKSSFINFIANRKKLAKVSKIPGKTITLNYYLCNDLFYLIDTPGYGFSKRSKETTKSFLNMLFAFLDNNIYYKKIFHFIDFKVGPNMNDIHLCNFFIRKGIEFIFMFTKHDKISNNNINKQLKKIKNYFKIFNISVDNFFLISDDNKEKIFNFILNCI